MKYIFFKTSIIITLIIIITSFPSFSKNDTKLYLRKGGNHLYLNDGNSELFWFNGVHSNDPNNIMFKELEKEFNTYVPDLVLVEGYRDKNIELDRNKSILKGESSFTVYLANKYKIDFLTVEPSEQYIANILKSKYETKDIQAMITFKQIRQWQRESRNRIIIFDEMITGFIHKKTERMFENFNLTIDFLYIQDILEPYLGYKITNENWLKVPARKFYKRKSSKLNKISLSVSDIRNNYLINLIKEKKNKYHKIFIMMGFDHAKVIKKDLTKIYE